MQIRDTLPNIKGQFSASQTNHTQTQRVEARHSLDERAASTELDTARVRVALAENQSRFPRQASNLRSM
jgi:hypothetical protein